MKNIIRVLSISALMAAQMLSVSHANQHNQTSPLGINTNEAMDINSSMPFVDLFKLSLSFDHARPWLTKGKVVYDENGWAKNLNGGQAGTRFISNLPANTIPTGLYTVLYKGEGKLIYGVDAKLVSHTAGKDIIRIKPGKNGRISASIIIKESNPQNYLRDIRILLPGGICMGDAFKRVNEARQCGNRKYLSFEQHHKQILFNPDYLNFMKDFKVIRFMNMSGITRNDLSSWDKRPKMSQATWGGKEGVRGAPLEVMVELANRIGADPWFNLPHKADDQFVRNYAQYVKANLNPNLKPYIEYTNEAWNGIFSQHHHMVKMGQKLRLDKNKYTAGSKYFSKRSVDIFKIWEGVYGANKNIVRVMGAFTTNKRLSSTLLSYQDAYKHTDALAIAPYFYIDQKEIHRIRSVDSVFKKLSSPSNKYSIPNILKHVKNQSEVAKKFKVSLIAYEGGQHLVAYKTHTVREGPNRYLIYANKDKRMAELYYRFLKGWQQNGGELFVAFSAPRLYTWIGSWGIKEYITQPASEAPKYQALLAFNKNEPCWWKGCKAPVRNFAKTVVAHAPTRQPLATRRIQDPLDFGNELPKYRVRSTAPVFDKVIANKTPTIRPLKEVFTDTVAVVSGKWGAIQHKIRKVRDANSIFSRHSNFRLMNVVSGNIQDSRDLAANWQAHWDRQHLHIRVDVEDDHFIKDSKVPWGDDSIEIFIDADGSKHSSYDKKNDFQFMYRWKDYNIAMGHNSPQRNMRGVKQNIIKTQKGYVLETSIPWKLLGIHPSSGHRIGIDVQINDDDDGSSRDGKLAWNAQDDSAWKNPQSFGQLVLAN
ncbi:MAG: sugar-binding protein [Thiotrichaceae bacterium]